MATDDEGCRAALRKAVRRALSSHGGERAAEVDEGVNAAHGVWGVDVTPKHPGAAPAYIAHPDGSEEVTVGFGQTHVYLWDKDPEVLAHEIEQILGGVFGGRIVEAGRPGDSFARVTDGYGDTTVVGAMHLPIPWRFRRRRTHQPYS